MSRLVITLVSLALLSAACAQDDPEKDKSGNVTQTPALAYASGWDQISMVVNGARTEVDNIGHFHTTPTACYREQYGASKLNDWNDLAKSVNSAIDLDPLPEPRCISAPSGIRNSRYSYYSFYQPVTIKSGNKTRTLFEPNGEEICSTIPNSELVASMAKALLAIAKTAYAEDCDQAGNLSARSHSEGLAVQARWSTPTPTPTIVPWPTPTRTPRPWPTPSISVSPIPIPSYEPYPEPSCEPSSQPYPPQPGKKGEQPKAPPAQKGEQKGKQQGPSWPIPEDPVL